MERLRKQFILYYDQNAVTSDLTVSTAISATQVAYKFRYKPMIPVTVYFWNKFDLLCNADKTRYMFPLYALSTRMKHFVGTFTFNSN